jgi:tetratricopeptide (TPR) repeat protein
LAVAAGIYAWRQRQNASAALAQAQINYQIALDQAAGSVTLLTDSYGEGGISTKLMEQLVTKAQKTISSLPGETDEVTAARASLLDVLSLAQVTLGNVADAEKFANEELKLADTLRLKEPKNSRWGRLEAAAHGRLSDVLFWKGDSVLAVQEARLARDLSTQLAAEKPQDEEPQFDLINQLRRLGEGLEDIGELEHARANYKHWIEIATARVAASHEDPKWLSSLAFARREIGDTLLTERRHAEAGIEYRASVQISANLFDRFPENMAYLYTLASGRLRVGDALYGQGEFERARSEYEATRNLTIKLLKSEPNSFRSRELLQAAYQRVGDVYLAEKKYDLASKEFRAYANLAVETQSGIPNNPNVLYDVTNAYQKIGDVLREEGKLEDALAAYQDSLKVAIDMNNASFWNGAWKKMLAMDYQRLAMVYRLKGDRGSAIAHFRKCAEIPVNNFVWSPRALWPVDVVEFCRNALNELKTAIEQ